MSNEPVPIRFGETIKSYISDPSLDAGSLTYIPLALAGWLRYLLGVDDQGQPIELSSDPLLSSLQEQLKNVRFGEPESVKGNLTELLSNDSVFGADLVKCGLSDKIEGYLSELIAGPGAVRNTLIKYLG